MLDQFVSQKTSHPAAAGESAPMLATLRRRLKQRVRAHTTANGFSVRLVSTSGRPEACTISDAAGCAVLSFSPGVKMSGPDLLHTLPDLFVARYQHIPSLDQHGKGVSYGEELVVRFKNRQCACFSRDAKYVRVLDTLACLDGVSPAPLETGFWSVEDIDRDPFSFLCEFAGTLDKTNYPGPR